MPQDRKLRPPATLPADLVAAMVVSIMLVPQSLAYALLAGLPVETGLYASVLPLVAYAALGSSRVLAVGPVAVISLMTATAISGIDPAAGVTPIAAALALAALSGVVLMVFGALKLGALANFLSHPVISGFMTASALIIIVSQVKPLSGLPLDGHTLLDVGRSLAAAGFHLHLPTAAVGLATIIFLLWARYLLPGLARRLGLTASRSALASRIAPVFAVIVAIAASITFNFKAMGIAVVGAAPQGLPPLTLPPLAPALLLDLLPAAAAIALIGFVESVSVAQTLAARRRDSVDPDRELLGLGAANIAAALSGGMPVSGGFARSIVNFDAGAATRLAGALSALGILFAVMYLTPYLAALPKAVLAAAIIVTVSQLVDFNAVSRVWRYARTDAAAMMVTIAVVLAKGVEWGVAAGVAVSLALHLWRTSRPHMAVVGRVPGSEHFRNVLRHHVLTAPEVLNLRVDESLYFANARYLETQIAQLIADHPEVKHLVLMCSAVNFIDASALESLEAINERLKTAGVAFHLSEIKGPVMDRLKKSAFLDHLTGQVFLSQYDALKALSPALAAP